MPITKVDKHSKGVIFKLSPEERIALEVQQENKHLKDIISKLERSIKNLENNMHQR